MIRRVFLAGFAAMLAILPARAQESGAFDCVIEPSVVSELGSTADGLIDVLLVKRGDVITAGTPIARLRSDAEKAALALAKSRAESSFAVEIARSRAEVLKSEADRQRALFDRKVSSTSVLEQALNAAAEAALELQQAEHERDLAVLEFKRSEIALGLRTITSPIDGVVMRLMMSPGEYVYEQAKIAQIARIDPLHVEVYLPIALYNNVRLGMEAEVHPAEPIGGVRRAKVIVVDKVFDSASDTFGVRLELPNPGAVMPAGINCNVTFQSS